MRQLDRVHHKLSMAVAAVLSISVGALLVVLGTVDDAAGRGQPVGDGTGSVDPVPVGGAFQQPVNVAFAPGQPDNFYVVEQDGTVEVVVGGVQQPAPFLDIREHTDSDGEQGLLGLAFHSQFASNGFVYAYYTDSDNGDIVVSEFHATATEADDESRRQVIRVRHRFAGNHNGGQVQFGPDGLMYLATGDGGGGGDPHENAQDKRSLLGKLLRINPLDPPGPRAYRSPKSNPYHGRKGRNEIYARGLRNPFRFTFDPVTERIAIGDVGQSRFEEVDYEGPKTLRGANFGWDRWEGFSRYRDSADNSAKRPKRKNHDKPVFAYGRGQCSGACSVIGGVVVRDPALGNLYGRYLFADAYRGELRSFIPRLSGADDVKYLDQDSVGFVSSFSADPASDEVYVTDRAGGEVLRLEPNAP